MVLKKEDITVLVIYCGFSSEQKISEKTGTAVIKALEDSGVKVIPYRLTRENVSKIADEKFDVAFIALHGRYGEDGTVQGYLDLLGKRYCGSGVMSSALCLNKYFTKKILMQHSIPTPEFFIYERLAEVDWQKLKAPIVIKPVEEGSSIGLSIVFEDNELKSATEKAFGYAQTVMFEKYISGREITVAVIEKDNTAKAMPIIEIKPKNKYFDYEAKYTKGMTEYIVPAQLSEKLKNKIEDLAVKSFKALACKDFARIDMMIDNNENVYVIEINTIPGMTETSLLPKAAAAAGIPFSELIFNFVKNNLAD